MSKELKEQSVIATRNDYATGEGNKKIPPPQPKAHQTVSLLFLPFGKNDARGGNITSYAL